MSENKNKKTKHTHLELRTLKIPNKSFQNTSQLTVNLMTNNNLEYLMKSFNTFDYYSTYHIKVI